MATYTMEQYTALCQAIADGTRRVKYTDKEIEYRSLNEMERIKATMERDLGLKPKGARVKASFSKGTV